MRESKGNIKNMINIILYPLLGIICYFLSTQLAYSLMYYYGVSRGYSANKLDSIVDLNYFKMDSLAMVFAFLFFVLIIKKRQKKVNSENIYKDYIYKDYANFKELFYSIIILLSAKGIVNIWFIMLDNLRNIIPKLDKYLHQFETGAGNPDIDEKYIFLFISIVFLGPIVEELLFRGIFFGELNLVFGRKVAILFSSLAFAIFHGDIIQMTYTFLLGFIFAYLYDRHRSIILAITLHIINNLLETLPPGLAAIDGLEMNLQVLYLLMIVPGIIIFIKMVKESKKDNIFK